MLPSAPLFPSCCLKCVALAPPVPPLHPSFSLRTRPPLMPSAPWTSALPTHTLPLCLHSFRPHLHPSTLNPDPSLSSPAVHAFLPCLSPSASVLQMSLYRQVFKKKKNTIPRCTSSASTICSLVPVEECVQGWRSALVMNSQTHIHNFLFEGNSNIMV